MRVQMMREDTQPDLRHGLAACTRFGLWREELKTLFAQVLEKVARLKKENAEPREEIVRVLPPVRFFPPRSKNGPVMRRQRLHIFRCESGVRGTNPNSG